MNRLQEQMNYQRSQLQFFSEGIRELEGRISKLKYLDKKIHMIANLEWEEERREDGLEPSKNASNPREGDVANETVAYTEVRSASLE